MNRDKIWSKKKDKGTKNYNTMVYTFYLYILRKII